MLKPMLDEPLEPVCAPDGRLVLSDQQHLTYGYRVLLPVRQALMDAGNAIAYADKPSFWQFYGDNDGFRNLPDRSVCYLRDPITPADWAILQTKFVFPPGIHYGLGGTISDDYNLVDLQGGVGPRDT